MKIENRSVAARLRNLASGDFRVALLYGETSSSLASRFKEIVSLFRGKKYDVANLAPDDLKGNEGALAEEFVATPMFSSDTLFILRLLANANMFTKHLEKLLETVTLENNRNFLLVTAGPLEPSSSLRKYAEKSEHIACIPCYGETQADLSGFVRKKLGECGLEADRRVIEHIASLGDSSATLENEIWKLDLSRDKNSRTISMEDVQNCLVNSSVQGIDNFLESFCHLDGKKAIWTMNRIFDEGLEPIVLVRSMIRHFLLIQRICFMLADGKSLGDIFGIEKIFWKSQSSLEQYIKKWTLESTSLLLEQMIGIERAIKVSFSDPSRELENFVLRYLG
ncbi:MAG: DNA polymerase III subunit delta [Rickettsiales bacterium]|jgi:DNA polymerase-3 subunit delta|nr:DNA polymerase III subunit delta [Rickettsiales bacterium]